MSELQEKDFPETPAPSPAGQPYSKGDVLHPEWGEAPPWFGYIGVGIAIVAMLVGIVVMVCFALYLWRQMGS